MSPIKTRLLWLMSAVYAFQGFNHILNPDFFLAIMPPGLPSPDWLNLLSGLAEIVLGVYLLEPRTRVFAAWGLIALLIAVFPANVYMALENVGLPDGVPGTGNPLVNWLRLPLQPLFIVWAWWYTRPETDC
jgi:uncharacterized membrane protein